MQFSEDLQSHPEPDLFSAPDDALARALIRCNRAPEAWSAAWARFSPLVQGTLRRRLGSRHDIDDVSQDVFLAFFRKVPELRQADSVRAFLLSITANTILLHVRKAWTHRAERLSDFSVEPPVSPSTLDPDVPPMEAALDAALSDLSAENRALLNLRYVEERDLAYIARVLDTSVATVKRRLKKVRTLVAKRLRIDPSPGDWSLGPGRSSLLESAVRDPLANGL